MSDELSRAIRDNDTANIPPGLLSVLTRYADFEKSDVSWLLVGLKSLDEAEQRKLVATFRKQIWHVAAQEAWEAAVADCFLN